jgi:hypothetical protein
MRFLLYQNIVLKYSWLMFYYEWILIRAIKTGTYYVHSFMKRSSWSHKLRYEEYLKVICMCLLDDMYTT